MLGIRYSSIIYAAFVLVFGAAGANAQSTPLPKRLSLNQAENLLIERNLAVIAARYQIEGRRAARLIAAYKPNPTVTVGLEQVPFYSPLSGSFPRFFTTNSDAGANPVYTLRLDQIWERGQKRELRTALADEDLKASEAQMLDAVRNQRFELRRAFASAALARENLKLAETAEQQYAQTENLTQVKVRQGDVAGVEVYRVGAGRLQYQQAVLQSQTSYDAAVRDVLNVLGASERDIAPAAVAQVAMNSDPQIPQSLTNAPLELVPEFDERPVFQTLEELRSLASDQRPDVIAARHLLASATSAAQLARAQGIRDLDTAYEYQRVGSDHSAGVVLQFPLLINNNHKALFTQAEAQRNAAEAQLKQAEFQATTEVNKAYQAYLSARRVLGLYSSQNLTQIDKLRTIATLSYREGASSLFELLDAQRAYNAALTSYNQARFDYQMARWRLEQAAGTSLQ